MKKIKDNGVIQDDILNALGEALITTDNMGTISRINPEAENMSGHAASDVLGKSLDFMIQFNNINAANANKDFTDQVLISGKFKLKGGTVNLITRDKKLIPIAGCASRFCDSNGNNQGVVLIFHDVSECAQAKEKLLESETHFRSLYENATLGMYRTTREGRILLANPALLQMLGYASFEELAFRNLEKEGYEPHYQRSEFLERIQREGEVRGLEAAWNRKDGSSLFIRESAKAIKDSEGNILYFEGTVEDITERKKAEEKVRLALAKYKTLFDNFPLGISVSDKDGKILEVNSIAEKLLGITREAHLKRTIDSKEWQIIRKDGKPMLQAEFASVQAMREGRKVENVEMGIIKPDQSITWINVTAAPIPLEKQGIVITYNDITTRKKAEEQIINLERRYRLLIENAPDGVVLIDGNGKYKYVSPSSERMFGYNYEDFLSRSSADRIHPEDLPLVLHELTTLINDPSRIPTLQYRYQHKNGEWRWIESTFSNQLAVPGMEGIIINFRDIHERKLAESELKKSQDILKYAQRLGRIGHLEWNGLNKPLVCSDEIYHILELEPQSVPISKRTFASLLTSEEYDRLKKPLFTFS